MDCCYEQAKGSCLCLASMANDLTNCINISTGTNAVANCKISPHKSKGLWTLTLKATKALIKNNQELICDYNRIFLI